MCFFVAAAPSCGHQRAPSHTGSITRRVTCVVLLCYRVQQLLPLQCGGVIYQVGDRGGDAGRGVTVDPGTRGAEHSGEGGAIGRVQQGAVMVGRLPAQPGRTSCQNKQRKI